MCIHFFVEEDASKVLTSMGDDLRAWSVHTAVSADSVINSVVLRNLVEKVEKDFDKYL